EWKCKGDAAAPAAALVPGQSPGTHCPAGHASRAFKTRSGAWQAARAQAEPGREEKGEMPACWRTPKGTLKWTREGGVPWGEASHEVRQAAPPHRTRIRRPRGRRDPRPGAVDADGPQEAAGRGAARPRR